ncbi:DJ-1/PfpI family protein [Phenylobacterium sp.]|uniref:DJ-1/PfpI family protein n=1 Tax=Phenylobacterium sp. TaxID=1871053 RepID=UPI0030F425CD
MRTLVLAAAATAATLAFLHPAAPFAAAGPSVALIAPDGLTLPAPKAGRVRPLVVVLADNAGAETTDFAIPYGVLKESGVADVRSVGTGAGAIQLMPSLRVLADLTTAQFDRAEPAGADIVIVPAQMKPKSPALAAWLRAQAAKGATIVSICEGARVLANAGLLHDRRATTHWSALKSLAKAYPDTTWVRDRRYVQDGRVISTTGVAASIPASLALVEAIAGRPAAQATAARIGVREWGAAHRTADFRVTAADYRHGIASLAAFWAHETVEAPITNGTDEVALALRTDTWSRTYRTKVVTTRPGLAAVRSRRGLDILPDTEPKTGRYVLPISPAPAAEIAGSLAAIDKRYGAKSARLAMLGLEYNPPR